MKKLILTIALFGLLIFYVSGCQHPFASSNDGSLCALVFKGDGPGNFLIKEIKVLSIDENENIVNEIPLVGDPKIKRGILVIDQKQFQESILIYIKTETMLFNKVIITAKVDRPELFTEIKNGNLFPNFSSIVGSDPSGKLTIEFTSCSNEPVQWPLNPQAVTKLAPAAQKTLPPFIHLHLPNGQVLSGTPQEIAKKIGVNTKSATTTWGKVKN